MSKPNEFPKPKGPDNIKEGIVARRVKLFKSQIEQTFFPLYAEDVSSESYSALEWENFFPKLIKVISNSLALDLFRDNQGLKTKCEDALVF